MPSRFDGCAKKLTLYKSNMELACRAMTEHYITTRAIFFRVDPFLFDRLGVEKWVKIANNDTDIDFPGKVEFSGEVTENDGLGANADDANETEFIRFKNVAPSAAGIVSQNYLKLMAAHDIADPRNPAHRTASGKIIGVKNPMTRTPISSDEMVIVMDEDNSDLLERYLKESSRLDFIADGVAALLRDDPEAFGFYMRLEKAYDISPYDTSFDGTNAYTAVFKRHAIKCWHVLLAQEMKRDEDIGSGNIYTAVLFDWVEVLDEFTPKIVKDLLLGLPVVIKTPYKPSAEPPIFTSLDGYKPDLELFEKGLAEIRTIAVENGSAQCLEWLSVHFPESGNSK